MNARERIISLLWWQMPSAENDAARAEAGATLDTYRVEVLAEDGQAYDGELVMLRGLLATLHAVAEHGDLADVRQLLAEHRRDNADARDEKATATKAAPATPAPAPYTASETAFMQIATAHWPRRAVLHLEGLPPLVGTYNGAGMRRPDHHDGLIVEPMLAFADEPEPTGKDGV
ncbi:hypothetical protein ACFZB2_38370 [Streptomyces bobili]|uniref:hypothetical protein n=1 Tax=Streptomyces bobili TaxID=67280 RepID=UPI0036E4B654